MEWDLTGRNWGNETTILRTRDGGVEIDLTGHHPRAYKFSVGDTLILRNEDGTSRYLLEKIKVMLNPPDQFFASASFFPRVESSCGGLPHTRGSK